MLIGSHLSSSGGFAAMNQTMAQIGASTYQYFSRNPRGSQKKKQDPKDLALFLKDSPRVILAHAPYTLNPASGTDSVRDFAALVLEEDLLEMESIPGNLYNFHPGCHVGQGKEEGTRLIVEALDRLTQRDLKTTILLETMAGKGTEIGSRFEELAEIIARVPHRQVLGVCLDTCHVHDAGYDIVNDLEGVLQEFDQIIGLERLKAIHLNDSKNLPGSRKDRHEKIGEGTIGLPAMIRIINHPRLNHLPFYLETPNDLDGYAREIELLRRHWREAILIP
ncbi:deoxyribonuclease IV [Proteiniclasticum sp. QWL-01]|uniref:deoxyribonuclease IV n=1 Tax=Proteiniclasticum sp. QWL-01 TaxID=3036945 RepID=UPI0024114A25|nr:deoxyribonuclease IV [Proteiniclasticum sp. QWL-01]WFF74551.1 deoxyribonuclease IV [Proteiniclasticum sp. QWL-01]